MGRLWSYSGALAIALCVCAPLDAGARECLLEPVQVWPRTERAISTRPVFHVAFVSRTLFTSPRPIERGTWGELISDHHTVPLEVRSSSGRGRHLRRFTLRPTRELAPRTDYSLRFVLSDGRVVEPTDSQQRTRVWTTADGPDLDPPAIVRAVLPVSDTLEPWHQAIEFTLPTHDTGQHRLRISLYEQPRTARDGRRDIDPAPQIIWAEPSSPDRFFLGERGCRRAGDVTGDRRWAMYITAVDAAGNETRVPGPIIFDGIDRSAERDLIGWRSRLRPPEPSRYPRGDRPDAPSAHEP